MVPHGCKKLLHPSLYSTTSEESSFRHIEQRKNMQEKRVAFCIKSLITVSGLQEESDEL